MKTIRTAILGMIVFVAFAAPGTAQKTNRGFWIQVKYGQTDVGKLSLNDTLDNVQDTFKTVFDGDQNVQSFGLGFRLNNWLGFQAEYHDFDEFFGSLEVCEMDVCTPIDDLAASAKTKSYSLSVVPQIPLTGSLTLFLKAGYASWDSTVSGDPLDLLSRDYSGDDFIYSGGLRLRLIAGLAIFYEYEVIADDIKSQYIGLGWYF